MEYKLNIVADKPTIIGRIYPRKVLEEALLKKEEFPVVDCCPTIDVKDFIMGIATATFSRISDSGEIFISVDKFIKHDINFKEILEEFKRHKIEIVFSFAGLGMVDSDNVVSNLQIITFYPKLFDCDMKVERIFGGNNVRLES